MAPSPKTKSSTPRLSDAARHVIRPAGIVTTGYPAVAQKLAALGIEFDPWQQDASKLVLAKNVDGKYAATVGGVVWSIPRQVGKTFTFGALMFALCLIFPGMTVLWTAHRLRTANETFSSMQAFARRKKIAPYIDKIVLGSGEEEIRFKNGSRILFGARERGFGLGFSEVDVLILDEAQRVTEAAIDDMVPTTNQARHPAGALVIYTGTPPRPTDPGEVFARKRRECLQGLVDDTLYIEFSAEKGADPMDRKQWRVANPSYPKRTPTESMLRMIRQLGPDSVPREMYGIWDDDETRRIGVTDFPTWLGLKVEAEEPSRGQITVDVAPDLDWTSLAVAAPGPEGRTLVLVDRLPGTDGGSAAVVALTQNLDEVLEVTLTPTAAIFSPALTKAGVEHTVLTSADLGRACTAWQEAVQGRRLAHVGQDDLNAAVKNGITRYVGDTQQWDRRERTIDVSALVAGSVAAHRWALLTAKPDTPPPPPRRAQSRPNTMAQVGF